MSNNKKKTLNSIAGNYITKAIEDMYSVDHKTIVLNRLKQNAADLDNAIDKLQIMAEHDLMASMKGIVLTMKLAEIVSAIDAIQLLDDKDPRIINLSLTILGEENGSNQNH